MATTSYSQTRWSLNDLFPGQDGSDIEGAFALLEQTVGQFETYREQLRPEISFDQFMIVVRKSEEMQTLGYRLYAYAGLSFSADTQDQGALTLMARVEQFLAEMSNRTLFFDLWWKALDDANATRLMRDAGDYTYWLEEMRHYKPHTLSEAE